MLKGTFDTRGRPWIRGYVAFPRLAVKGFVNFLIDTGADSTVIHPADGLVIGIPFDDLGSPSMRSGIGGKRAYFEEDAVIFFADDASSLHPCPTGVSVAKPDARGTLDHTPSLLGRPLLNSWRMLYDPRKGIIEIAYE